MSKQCDFCGMQNISNTGSHSKVCKQYQQAIQALRQNVQKHRLYVKDAYVEQEVSAFEIAKEFCGTISHQKTYTIVCDILKEEGVFDPFRNTSRQKEQTRKAVQQRYGVSNYGQTNEQQTRLNEANNLLRFAVDFDEDFRRFKYRVDTKTRRKKHLIESHEICYYTGVTFTDVLLEKVNPNDAFKRTVDHKTSVLEGYLKGMTPDDVASAENMCFCIKYVNTLKGHMSEADFKASGLLQSAIKRIENASKERDEHIRKTNTM